MGLQAIMNALHRNKDIRVDIQFNAEDTQLDVWKYSHYSQHFEIYPPLGIALILENIAESRKYAEMTFQALPRNGYAKSLRDILEGFIQRKEVETFYFEKYPLDTRSLCSFIQKYFSFVDNVLDSQGEDSL